MKMVVVKNWITEAASEIADTYGKHPITDTDGYAQIIEKHCPFKRDMAYMPVPRCDQCKHGYYIEEHARVHCERMDRRFDPDFRCVWFDAEEKS